MEEIAGVVGVARSTLYENLSAYKDGGDCVLVAYRITRPGKVEARGPTTQGRRCRDMSRPRVVRGSGTRVMLHTAIGLPFIELPAPLWRSRAPSTVA